jgi:hypothetical protein
MQIDQPANDLSVERKEQHPQNMNRESRIIEKTRPSALRSASNVCAEPKWIFSFSSIWGLYDKRNSIVGHAYISDWKESRISRRQHWITPVAFLTMGKLETVEKR